MFLCAYVVKIQNRTLPEFADKPEDKCNQYTKQDHRYDRKIKPEVFFFDPDITGQAADPG